MCGLGIVLLADLAHFFDSLVVMEAIYHSPPVSDDPYKFLFIKFHVLCFEVQINWYQESMIFEWAMQLSLCRSQFIFIPVSLLPLFGYRKSVKQAGAFV